MSTPTTSPLLQKLNSGQNVYGTCITATGPMWLAAVQRTGIDFVFLDTEHVPLNRSELAVLCQSFKAHGVTPIVRIPKPDPYLVCEVLDGGAEGVIAPYLESVEQIYDLVGATKFRPLKGEVLAKYLTGGETMPDNLKEYIEARNSRHITIANIESVPAMEKLDELLSVPGLDGVFIGPHDLSVSMGIPEDYDNPVFEEAVKFIIHKTREKGLAIGIHFSLEPERQIQWIKEGANIVVHSFDVALFSQRLSHDLKVIKTAVGDAVGADTSGSLVV